MADFTELRPHGGVSETRRDFVPAVPGGNRAMLPPQCEGSSRDEEIQVSCSLPKPPGPYSGGRRWPRVSPGTVSSPSPFLYSHPAKYPSDTRHGTEAQRWKQAQKEPAPFLLPPGMFHGTAPKNLLASRASSRAQRWDRYKNNYPRAPRIPRA